MVLTRYWIHAFPIDILEMRIQQTASTAPTALFASVFLAMTASGYTLAATTRPIAPQSTGSGLIM